ncbi:hypothetical protein [Rhodocaloribacter sp.]
MHELFLTHAMLASILSRTVGIGRTYARLRFVSLVCFLAAFSVPAFSFSGRAEVYATPLSLLFLSLYLMRKGWLALRSHHAARQLGMERQFLRYVQAAPDLLSALLRHGRIRRRSLLASTLSARLAPPAPFLQAQTPPSARQCILRRMPLPRPGFDALLLLLSVLFFLDGDAAVPPGNVTALALFVGVTAVITPAEMYRLFLLRRLRRSLPSLAASFGAWTREAAAPLHTRPESGPRYRHTPLYRARPRPRLLDPSQHLAA